MEKRCPKCCKFLPLGKFALRSKNSRLERKSEVSKRQAYCKRCTRKSPKARWRKLSYNLKRHHGVEISISQLQEGLGKPSRCYICGEAIISWSDSELDHVIPLSRNGKTHLKNLRWTHKRCNRMKHDLLFDEFIEYIRKILSYHQLARSE